MNFTEIGKTKLIFHLSPTDMEHYRLNCKDGIDQMKDGYSRMVCDLGLENDFMKGVLVEIFDSKNGGCEMFVTKLPEGCAASQDSKGEKKRYPYIYESLDELILSCKLLNDKGEEAGILYRDEERGSYYLILEREWSYLGEFNARRCSTDTLEFLYEHCRRVTDGAIQKLSSLA